MNYDNIGKVEKIIDISYNMRCTSYKKKQENKTNKKILKSSEEKFLEILQDIYNESKDNK